MPYRNIDGIPEVWCIVCQKWIRADRLHKCEPIKQSKEYLGSL